MAESGNKTTHLTYMLGILFFVLCIVNFHYFKGLVSRCFSKNNSNLFLTKFLLPIPLAYFVYKGGHYSGTEQQQQHQMEYSICFNQVLSTVASFAYKTKPGLPGSIRRNWLVYTETTRLLLQAIFNLTKVNIIKAQVSYIKIVVMYYSKTLKVHGNSSNFFFRKMLVLAFCGVQKWTWKKKAEEIYRGFDHWYSSWRFYSLCFHSLSPFHLSNVDETFILFGLWHREGLSEYIGTDIRQNSLMLLCILNADAQQFYTTSA